MSPSRRHLHAVFFLLLGLLVTGCATQKKQSMILLLPEEGKPAGEVLVQNAGGSQLLNRPYQAVRITDADREPERPVVLEGAALRKALGPALKGTPEPPAHYQLYFKLDTVELVPESQLLLAEIVRAVQARKPCQLSVVGHTDTMGSVQYNYRLGQQRAAAVVELLLAQGAAPASIETSSRGKSELLLPTPDQVLEPRNRRAEVTVR